MSFPSLPELGASARSFVQLATPIAIGSLPVILHVIDKGMERFTPIRHEVLRVLMRQDARQVVQQIGLDAHEEFDAVKTYFDFERKCHFVIALSVFNMVSLYVAQTECTKDLTCATWITLLELIGLAVFLVIFLVKLANRTFQIADITAAGNWVKMSIGAFAVVIVTELILHFVPEYIGVNCVSAVEPH